MQKSTDPSWQEMRSEVFEKGRDCVCVCGKQKWRALRWRALLRREKRQTEDFWKSKSLQIQGRLHQLDVYRLLHVCESLWYAMRFSWHKPFDISMYTIYLTVETCSFLLMYIYVCVCVCQQVSSPSIHPLLLKLRDAERQGAHKVVPAGQVPVPDLHRQPAVLVRLFQITVRHRAQEGGRQRQRNQAQHFILHFTDKQVTDLLAVHWCRKQSESFLTMWRSHST